jgi:ribosomal protein S18 acetylase RimI-like enzyme
MPIPDHLHRFWRAADALFGAIRPTWWGAVVTDGRFPAIWDTNYARIDAAAPELSFEELAGVLLPELRAIGAETFHVVSFQPEETTALLAELSSRGHRLGWDVAMDLAEASSATPDARVEELDVDDALWERVQDSMELFGVEGADATAQLRRIEQDVLAPGGKRWFGVRDDGLVVSMAALVLLEGVGYVDNVATFPEARGRGYASAITVRISDEARAAGADHVCLFADPEDAPVVRMYERLGFREVGRLASTKGPLPQLD